MNIRITIAAMLGMLLAGNASARTMDEVTNTCPACCHAFTCMMDMSGYQSGMRLDLRPLGPTPSPWSLAVCPECGFVLYEDDIPAEELAKCREIIAKDGYKRHSARASYFLLGLLYEGLEKESLDIGHVFLKASWQEEQEQSLLKEDLERSLRHFEVYLGKHGLEDGEEVLTAQMLKGELLRRLGRFDEALEHLEGLRKLPGLRRSLHRGFRRTYQRKIVDYEIQLCGQKDSAPHALSELD